MKINKPILIVFLILFITFKTNAQIGIGTTNPLGALDITSTTDGLLIPRVALTATTTVLPILTGTTSELVYNTNTAGDVIPGFYYLSSATGPWIRLGSVSTNSWLITGNTNIVDGTNFLGTAASTNIDVAFRRNNLPAGKIGTTSTSLGVGALLAGATTNSTAFGTNALTANTTGTDNVAIGNGSLATNITGAYNTAIGTSALAANTANGNTAIGFNALTTNTGGDNTAVGYQALKANTNGIQNTAVGVNALQQKTIGSANTAIGHSALNALGTFANVTAVGYEALKANTVNNNTGIGFQALWANTTGTQNTAVGFQAGNLNTTGFRGTFIGDLAGNKNNGIQNTYIGCNAAGNMDAGASGNNVAIGFNALQSGTGRVNSNTVAIGAFALEAVAGGAGNNTAVGYLTATNLSGSNNVILGYQASGTSGSNSTSVGQGANFASFSNATALGNGAIVGDSNNMKFGNAAIVANHFSGKIGLAAAGVVPNGSLDLNVTNDGIVPAKAALTSTGTVAPVITGTEGELIYNTNTSGDVTPGYYYLSTATGPWVRVGAGAASSGWALTGNAGVLSTNFMGSTNDADVLFRRNSLPSGRIGSSTTSFGVGAAAVVTGVENTAIGVDALGAAGTAKENTAIGYNALLQNTGDANTAVGDYALATQLANAFRTTGVGFSAGRDNTQIEGTFFGFEAGRRNTGPLATLIGHECGTDNQGTTSATIVGNDAGYFNKGDSSTLIGQNSGRIIEAAGDYNCFVGARTGEAVTTGSKNTFIGTFSGLALATGIENTFLGYGAGATGNFSNTICIGNGVNPTADNDIRIGSGTAGIAFVNAASWSYSSDRRLKSDIKDSELGLNFIKTIRPVSYYRKDDVNKKTEYGFIAQELEKALDKAGSTNNGILSKTANGMFAVRYNDFLPMTIKAVQEQQALIEELQKTNAELMKTNAAILKRLEKLEKK